MSVFDVNQAQARRVDIDQKASGSRGVALLSCTELGVDATNWMALATAVGYDWFDSAQLLSVGVRRFRD